LSLVQLPGTDLVVSGLCLGTVSYGTAIPRADAFQLMDRFHELGGNFVDTANIYGNWVKDVEPGISEKTIGAWITERGNRSQIVVGTKGAHHDLQAKIPRLAREEINFDLEASLVNLQTDTIDLYWLHRDDPTRPVEDIIDTLDQLEKAGKIRYYGASNWSTARIAAANSYAAATGKSGFKADQVLWNVGPLAHQPYGDPTVDFMSDERFEAHLKTGMAEIPYQSQANGLFQRMHSGALGQLSQSVRSMYRADETQQRYLSMVEIMQETGLSITQVVLGYLRGQPFTTVPIIGSRNLEQLDDSMSGIESVLTAEQIATIGPAPHHFD